MLNEGVFGVALLIGLFTWFYPARLVRTQLLTLRRSEFVDTSVVSGAERERGSSVSISCPTSGRRSSPGARWPSRRASCSDGVTFLNAGVRLPTASWGRILADTWGSPLAPSRYNPAAVSLWPTIFASTAIFVAVVALHEIGEALQRVFGTERPR